MATNPQSMSARRRLAPLALLAVCLLGAVSSGRARTADRADHPDAETVLRGMSDFLTGLDGFHLEANLTFDDVPTSGVKVQYSGRMTASLRRPDRLYVDYRDDLSAHRVWIDGESLTVLEPADGIWARIESTPNLEDTLARLVARHGHSLPLDDFFVTDPYSRLMAGVTAQRNLGLRDVAGTRCHHLVFRRDDLTWQVWVEAGDRPVPRKMVITYTTLPLVPQYVLEIESWDLEARLPDELFRPQIPTGAVEVGLATLEGSP